MEITVITEAEQVQLEGFALYHAFSRNIGDGNGGKIRLSGNRTQGCKLRTIELNKIIVIRMLGKETAQVSS